MNSLESVNYNPSNAELTLYSDIYNNTYWGDFRHMKTSNEIHHNRDKFIMDYHILDSIDYIPYSKKEKKIDKLREDKSIYIDHLELYLTLTNEYILIISVINRQFNDDDYFKRGFIKIYPLYMPGTTTYLKYI